MDLIRMTFSAILFCSILLLFSSCKEQNQNIQGKAVTTINIGDTVTEIDKSIWVIFQDKKNHYWFGSNGKGAYYFNGKTLKQFTTRDGLSSDQIRGIQEDRSGNIFFDTPNGVSKFDGRKFSPLTPIKSVNSQWKLQPGDLWFKGNGDITGAYRYDGQILHHLEFSSLNSKAFSSDYAVYSIYKDKQGNVWFGTLSAGVCRFDGAALDWIYEKELSVLDDGRVPGVRSILEDKNGSFWFSNIISRYRIDHNNPKTQGPIEYEKLKGIELSQQQVQMKLPYFNSAVLDNESLWMTNYKEGAWKYDGKKLTNYRIKDGETNVLLVSIYKDNDGVLWLGTDNAGVYKLHGETFEKFRP